jgi:hypothetical protein
VQNYHAYLSETELVPDAVLVVTGGTLPVDVQASDRLSIECPLERRIDALVLERGDGTMLLAVSEGPVVALRIGVPPGYEELALSSGFSRQCWVVQ